MTSEVFQHIFLPTPKFKTSTTVPLVQQLNSQIATQFGITSQNVTKSINDMQKWRDSMINNPTTELLLTNGVFYYNNLSTLMRRMALSPKNFRIEFQWIDTIKTTVPPKFLDVNLEAFNLGYNL